MKTEYEIVQELNEQRELRERERFLRVRRLENDSPEYRNLVSERNALLAQAALERLSGNHEGAAENEKRARDLDTREAEILKERGLDEDYLRIHYDCPLCNDRGFTGDGQMCSCLKKKIKASKFSAYDLTERTREDNFDNFDLSLFEDYKDDKTGITPYKAVRVNLQRAHSYCDNYGENSGSLILSGPPGTGKTYMISCIVNELLEREIDLIYISAHNIVQLLYDDLNEHKPYRLSNRAAFKEAELLIIDDLGAEIDSDFSRSAMSEIIDERLVTGKKTIISTNLNIKEDLQLRYPNRMASRILGLYERLFFVGKDLRQNKRKNED